MTSIKLYKILVATVSALNHLAVKMRDEDVDKETTRQKAIETMRATIAEVESK